jgi:hypothetical protein
LGKYFGSRTNRDAGSISIPPAPSTIPERKVIEEMCPSPVARRLRMTRSEPSGRSDWSGWGTMLGLKSAAHSNEYSLVKYEPVRSLRFSESGRPIGRYAEIAEDLVQQRVHLPVAQRQNPREDFQGARGVHRIQRPLLLGGKKRADENPAGVRLEVEGQAFQGW